MSIEKPDFTAYVGRIAANCKVVDEDKRTGASRINDKHNRAIALWEDAKVPPRHARWREAGNTVPQWIAARSSIVEKLGNGAIFVICGLRGVGKTQMAVSVIRSQVAKGRTSRYIKAMDFFVDLRGCYGKDAETKERHLIDAYTRFDLLVIDAMEERSEGEWENRILSHLIDRRYDAIKDTILVTNTKRDQLQAALGPSIVSRARETGGAVECTWVSFR